jgi:hypothetical protein
MEDRLLRENVDFVVAIVSSVPRKQHNAQELANVYKSTWMTSCQDGALRLGAMNPMRSTSQESQQYRVIEAFTHLHLLIHSQCPSHRTSNDSS